MMANARAKTRAPKARTENARRQVSSPAVDAHTLEQPDVLLDAFAESLRVEQNASEHTVRAYMTDLDAYLRWCKRHDVDALTATHRDLRSYLGELDAARYARTTINRHLSSLRGFYRWLTITKQIENDPASVLSGPKQSRHLPHVLQPAEMVRLLRVHSRVDLAGNSREQTVQDMRDQALLEFLYACGARISEASGLKMADIDFASKQVKVFGKGRKERIIPLHDLCINAMQIYARNARDTLLAGKQSSLFFVSNSGGKMSEDSIRKMFKRTVREAGLDERLSPHDMRHTFATDLLDGGADLRSVQEMLGHASLSTTQIYTHVSPTRLKAVHTQAHPRG